MLKNPWHLLLIDANLSIEAFFLEVLSFNSIFKWSHKQLGVKKSKPKGNLILILPKSQHYFEK